MVFCILYFAIVKYNKQFLIKHVHPSTPIREPYFNFLLTLIELTFIYLFIYLFIDKTII